MLWSTNNIIYNIKTNELLLYAILQLNIANLCQVKQIYYVIKYCTVSPFSKMSGIDKSLVIESREMAAREQGREGIMLIANGYEGFGGLNKDGTCRLII